MRLVLAAFLFLEAWANVGPAASPHTSRHASTGVWASPKFDSLGMPIIEGTPAVGCLCGATYQKVGDGWGCVGADPSCRPTEAKEPLGTIATAPPNSTIGVGPDGKMAWVTPAALTGDVMTTDLTITDTSTRLSIDLSWFSAESGWRRVRGGALVKWDGGWHAVTVRDDGHTVELQ